VSSIERRPLWHAHGKRQGVKFHFSKNASDRTVSQVPPEGAPGDGSKRSDRVNYGVGATRHNVDGIGSSAHTLQQKLCGVEYVSARIGKMGGTNPFRFWIFSGDAAQK
jgi:hypothetical protein